MLGIVGILAIVSFLFFVVNDEIATISVVVSHEEMIAESVKYVELLIDGGCKAGEIYIETDEACSLVIDCQGPNFALLRETKSCGSLRKITAH